MGTYDPKQILSDYDTGKITVEAAVMHSLQHIDKLYDILTNANINRYELRSKADLLERKITVLHTKVDRLTALMEKLQSKRNRKASGKLPKDQP